VQASPGAIPEHAGVPPASRVELERSCYPKLVTADIDGLTGDARAAADTFEQYLGKVLEPRFLLDASVAAVNLFVPGTQLARIVVQHGVKQVIEHRKHEA
jgi:hypothetical protein